MATLGLIAGGGRMPRAILDAAAARGRPVFVIAFEGQTDLATVARHPHGWCRMGGGEQVLKLLRGAGVEDLVMAGKFIRPSLGALKPDGRTAVALGRIAMKALGDDGLLRAVAAEFEREGFRIVAVADVLPQARAGSGLWTRAAPTGADAVDIARGIEVCRALGGADVGQAVIVQQGIVLGVEAAEGTDALIARCGALKREGGGGVLVKLAKPGQDNRLDLPTIGPETLRRLVDGGYAGLLVEAERTLVVDQAETVDLADRHGLFIEARILGQRP
jgi:hypothetical protein